MGQERIHGHSSSHRPVRRAAGAFIAAGLLLAGLTVLSVTGTAKAAEVAQGTQVVGTISYYGKKFAGRKTASGERFDPAAMTMAHPSWPFGTQVRVTNLANQKSVVLRVNDRGPSIKDRIADVSSGAARKLDMIKSGLAESRLEVVGLAPRKTGR